MLRENRCQERIDVGMTSNRLYMGGSNWRISHPNLELRIWWQAQCLWSLNGDSCCSAHWKWRFICDADHSCDAFCVAGAIFGEVAGGLFVAGAGFRDILGDSRTAKYCIFSYKMRREDGRSQVSEAAGARWPRIVFKLAEAIQGFRDQILNSEFGGRRSTWWVWRVTWLAPRISNDVSYVTRINYEIHFAWQAQYLVKLEGDSCCSAQCKWRFKVVPE